MRISRHNKIRRQSSQTIEEFADVLREMGITMEATSAESYECKRQTESISNSRCTYDDLTSTFKPQEISRDQPLRFGFRGSACAISSQQTGIGSERRALMNSSEYSYHGYCVCACAFFCVCALNSSPPHSTQGRCRESIPHTHPTPYPPPGPRSGPAGNLPATPT